MAEASEILTANHYLSWARLSPLSQLLSLKITRFVLASVVRRVFAFNSYHPYHPTSLYFTSIQFTPAPRHLDVPSSLSHSLSPTSLPVLWLTIIITKSLISVAKMSSDESKTLRYVPAKIVWLCIAYELQSVLESDNQGHRW